MNQGSIKINSWPRLKMFLNFSDETFRERFIKLLKDGVMYMSHMGNTEIMDMLVPVYLKLKNDSHKKQRVK